MDRFSAAADSWDEPHRVERAHIVAESIRAVTPMEPGMTAIEIGGGTGLLSRSLADVLGQVTVTDIAPGMVDAATKVLADPQYEGWQARLYDIEHDPLPEERYDLALSLLALHHMGDIPAVLRSFFALLNPGGALAVADLDEDPEGGFHARHDDFDGHHGFSRDTFGDWLEAAGFVDVALTTAHVEPMVHEGKEQHFPLFLATAHKPE